jgi:hypothetical protein
MPDSTFPGKSGDAARGRARSQAVPAPALGVTVTIVTPRKTLPKKKKKLLLICTSLILCSKTAVAFHITNFSFSPAFVKAGDSFTSQMFMREIGNFKVTMETTYSASNDEGAQEADNVNAPPGSESH